ncbi:MAG: Phosphoserine phosphatase [Candidatus Methanofastidiosum methylothiophilum]|uniref:phosphoserine phosphatase n=1 Tax=Candidatus Methanofastidiosum methylothiophilum TaxID=1705564 RepID=A0A150IYV6_9EURY|nr:MAG: Phosphoserine phosphatase [Candidatus Methanofastidiosum methylthiophilus]KYC47551.1 MAG: Phosphoserine phosphatase [Candidatus Methanofastidiosum methylthiophilus]KYC50181.1 MAG: Phosphoserine phosphatase [Candidatus Methanofastidiosum methylthiophilus]
MVSAIVFDLDGVLIESHSSWERLHEYFGADEEKRKENMRRYFSKEIDYGQWIREDVSLWRRNGILPHKSEVEDALKNYIFIDGVRECIKILKSNQFKLFIVSAGIDLLALNAGKVLGIEDIWANGFQYDEKGYLTGEDVWRVDLLRKDTVINQIIDKYKLNREDILSIGDSKYDIPMFEASGFSIAFDPKDEEVKMKADVTICERNLLRILEYI